MPLRGARPFSRLQRGGNPLGLEEARPPAPPGQDHPIRLEPSRSHGLVPGAGSRLRRHLRPKERAW
uniref:Uncharacterized protein n=1 Tax=Rhizophora mucronata TaxID=61149 RepID=A0A2P2JIF3_RHIMU